MNRRDAIRKAVGLGLGAAALPLAAKAVSADSADFYAQAISAPPGNAPAWTPPPADTRTPEQVVEDAERNWAESLVHEATADYTKYFHNSYRLPNHIFNRVERLLVEKQIPFEKRDVAGRPSLIVNGNVYQQDWIILHTNYSNN